MTNLLKDLNIIKNDYCLENQNPFEDNDTDSENQNPFEDNDTDSENQNVTTINENDEEFKNSITSINSTQSSLINKKKCCTIL